MSRQTFTWEDGKRKTVDISELTEEYIFFGNSLTVICDKDFTYQLMIVPAGFVLATFVSRDEAIQAALSLYDRKTIDWDKLNRNLQGFMFEISDDADKEAYQKAIWDACKMTFGHKASAFYFTIGYVVATAGGWAPALDDMQQ